MEGFMEGLGAVSLILLVVIGAVAGWIASAISGGGRLKFILLGITGAMALPFILAALGVGVLAAGGLLLIALVALVGAIIVLLIARAIFR